jgi:hypothetical protein
MKYFINKMNKNEIERHVADKELVRNACALQLRYLKERVHLGDPGADAKIQ